MVNRRRNTIHDFSSLRLHLDGRRVQQSRTTDGAELPENFEITRRGTKRRRAGLVVQDPRGNWIALDAVGTANVPKKQRRKYMDKNSSEITDGEFFRLSDVSYSDEESTRDSETEGLTVAGTKTRQAKSFKTKVTRKKMMKRNGIFI